MLFWCVMRATEARDWTLRTENCWRVFWKRGLVTASVFMIATSYQGKVRINIDLTFLHINPEIWMEACIIWTLVVCSCSGCHVWLHRGEPDRGSGSHLSRSWSWVRPAECHPCCSCGAADSLDFHQNWDHGSVDARFPIWGPATSQWGCRLRHLEGPKLHVVLLLLLETATLLSTGLTASF